MVAPIPPAHPPHHQPQPVVHSSATSSNNNTTTTSTKRKNGGGRRTKSARGAGKNSTASNNNNKRSSTNKNATAEEEPPFMLFDAPVELRHNFEQSQRLHGLPELHDNNSYHFQRSTTATTTHGASSSLVAANNNNNNKSTTIPRLADARHGDTTISGSKRLKNAKEQKRAQRITELIDQLRVRMEKGGWKVGIKSKLHTLSSYVNMMMMMTSTSTIRNKLCRSSLSHFFTCSICFFQMFGLCQTLGQSHERKGSRCRTSSE